MAKKQNHKDTNKLEKNPKIREFKQNNKKEQKKNKELKQNNKKVTKKTKEIKQNNKKVEKKKKVKMNTNTRKNTPKSQKNISESIETNNTTVLDLLTKYPELNQTFEYMLYSNKYKHTLTDVFNIIKMLMSKLEELQKNNIDIKNICETINFNYKIKGLVQSTAINLSHVVEQLNVNESSFLNFAKNYIPLKILNDTQNALDNINVTSTPMILEEPIVSSSLIHNNFNQPCSPIEVKMENTENEPNTEIFGHTYTIILSSDDEYEELTYDQYKNQNLTRSNPRNNEHNLESYVIGSNFTDISTDYDSSGSEAISSKQSQNNTIQESSSKHKKPVPRTKRIKEKVSDKTINEARKSDMRFRKRLYEHNNEMLNIVRELNLKPHEIVLEFDMINKKPLVTIQKELAKVLKKHQVEGIRFLWNTVFETVDRTNTTDGTGCILAHRMGIGKTLQIVTLMHTILCHSQINIKTFLIICPPGLIYNWMNEIYKWLKDIDNNEIIKVYDLPKTNKLYNITNIATWKSKGGILILSYENFKSLVNCKQLDLKESFSHTLVDPGPDIVILDEGHYIKNTNTMLLKSLTQIRTKRRIVLTGTPMQNSLKEYFTMVDFVKPNILGNFSDFSTLFMKPINSGQFLDSSDEAVKIMKQRTFILHKLLQNTIHRIDDRNLKPLFTEKIEYTLEVNMTKFQCELYKKFLHYNKTSNDSCGVFLRLHVLTLITIHPLTLYKLVHDRNSKQLEFGTAATEEKFVKDLAWISDYADDPRFFESNQSNKIIYLLKAIDECQKRNEKVLCFLKSPLALDVLEYFLQENKNWTSGKDYFRMDGKTPLSIRNQMCEAFNNFENPVKLFILSLGTGVLGYNMVGANRVLLLSTSWNPSNDLQAIYRCLRFGQKKTVYVNRLLAKGTVEPKAYYRQISKLGMASSVVDLQHVNRKVSYDQTNDLFTFNSSKHFSNLVPNTKDPILNQLIRCHYGSICDIKEHDSMLVESMEGQLTAEERRECWLSFKKNELRVPSLIKPKPLYKLQNIEQSKTNSNITQIINEDIKQEIDNDNLVFQSEEQKEIIQLSIQKTNEINSSRCHTQINNPGLSTPIFSGTQTKCINSTEPQKSTNLKLESKNHNFNEKRNQWNNVQPIHNQFKHFQNKTFIHHKRYHPTNNKFRNNKFKAGVPSDQSDQNLEYSNYNESQNRHPNYRTPTENNIHNRSGMF